MTYLDVVEVSTGTFVEHTVIKTDTEKVILNMWIHFKIR